MGVSVGVSVESSEGFEVVFAGGGCLMCHGHCTALYCTVLYYTALHWTGLVTNPRSDHP
jgi:hypothetical protein